MPPTPAAIANAIDDAIGVRIRDLPITTERLQARLMELEGDELDRVRIGG
jgi:CO/xanthine dehydrogenase Mo-binding subunit